MRSSLAQEITVSIGFKPVSAHGDSSMNFWNLAHPDNAPAAIEASSGRSHSYGELRVDVTRIQNALPQLDRKSLGIVISSNKYNCLAAYLAALNAGCATILLDSALNETLLGEFVQTYRPDWIFSAETRTDLTGYRGSSSGEQGLLEAEYPQPIQIHPDVALLLTTSGSTGSPKLVRLTLRNLAANAESIRQYLRLTCSERPITSLPMSYSYGLSVINSHLHVGASIVLTDHGVLQRGLWDAIDRFGCTSLAGVPYTYQMLLQTGLLTKRGASIKTLTQAGGRLDEHNILKMYGLAHTQGSKFFVMYGQTEATARISYVPFEDLSRKIGSVGIAIPNGSLKIDDVTGELIYRGPNVMMGYAESRDDLAKGDEMQGELRTGDLARQDDDGYFYITGRLKRFLKMFGKRFNLDDVEKVLSRHFDASVACYGRDDLLMVAVESSNTEAFHATICETFDLPRPAVKVMSVKELPRTPNGKLDYTRLAESGRQQEVAAAG
jgi:acyl-CoA synthetase (AMP-forming)/AMP-acid ligase II